MKIGKPIVGARSGGTVDLIQDGTTGLLFELGSIDDLVEKLARLYRDGVFRMQLGQRAQEWASRTFTSEQFTAALLSVFGEINPAAASGPGKSRNITR
jgi:glycosyltransferase involved in cell wall biosynthesis